MLPNFFIVGTPKAGTTSLYEYLQEHPQIFMSPIKETNYFSYDEIKAQGLFYNEEHIATRDQYLNQFKDVKQEKAIGEASVSYLFYPSVPGKIKAFNPEAKIIMVLRNPIERGFSHYLMDKRLGFLNEPFEKIARKKVTGKKGELYYQQYIQLGLYHPQLDRYFSTFEPDNILVLLYEDIVKDINGVVKSIYKFLEVDTEFTPDTNKQHNAFMAPKNPLIQKFYSQKIIRTLVKTLFGEAMREKIKSIFFTKEKKPVLDPQVRTELVALYADDIKKVSTLINRNLDHWLK